MKLDLNTIDIGTIITLDLGRIGPLQLELIDIHYAGPLQYVFQYLITGKKITIERSDLERLRPQVFIEKSENK